jgi:hypothetical protein
MFPVPTRSTTINHIGQRIKTSAIDNIEQECLPVNTEQEFKTTTSVKDIIHHTSSAPNYSNSAKFSTNMSWLKFCTTTSQS